MGDMYSPFRSVASTHASIHLCALYIYMYMCTCAYNTKCYMGTDVGSIGTLGMYTVCNIQITVA